jgi:hypothetical protein
MRHARPSAHAHLRALFLIATWPGLTEDAINKYLKLTPTTTIIHMNQKQQNIRSTNKKVKYESDDEDITPQG